MVHGLSCRAWPGSCGGLQHFSLCYWQSLVSQQGTRTPYLKEASEAYVRMYITVSQTIQIAVYTIEFKSYFGIYVEASEAYILYYT